MSALEVLLREATLALEARLPGDLGVIEGTGFLVAPGVVATCAHVLAEHREALPGTVTARTASGRELALTTVPEWYLRERKGGLDLAFLSAPADAGPYVELRDVVEAGERLWTYGHPAGTYRAGQSALFTAQGISRLRAVDANGRPLGEEWQPGRVFGTPVGGGYSGSAVLSHRTGAVCGMLFSAGKEGSAHMVAAADILAGLEQAGCARIDPGRNTQWLQELDDEQIRIGGWPYPGPRLRAYLKAAILVARKHPYPGVAPAPALPPLTTVHLRQQVRPTRVPTQSSTTSERQTADSERPTADPGVVAELTAQEILQRNEGAVVIAGPGGGKSTLLRTGLIALAERWRADDPCGLIPVLMPAADLVSPRPWHEALAESVKRSLSPAGTAEDWPPQFFKDAPLRNVRWLVMVDGLDEITDAETRNGVITKLVNASIWPDSPYVVIATTRPLPAEELPEQSLEGWPVQCYDLMPFTARGLGQFAGHWFTAQNLPDPWDTAQHFIGAVKRRRLDHLARIPLMATMLCQLYSALPAQPLPAARGHIYQKFVELLDKRRRDAGLRAQTRAALQEYGEEALAAAEHTLKHLQSLIAGWAAAQHRGSTISALDFLAVQQDAARPQAVPHGIWSAFLEESVRSSGLVAMHAGQAVFLHQTLVEYLAAWHDTHDVQSRARTYKELSLPAVPTHTGVVSDLWTRIRERRRNWKPPSHDSDSYLGFLLDIGQTEADDARPYLERFLTRLATQGGMVGCRFIAGQARLGTYLPPSITQAAADTLSHSELARWNEVSCAQMLIDLGDRRGADLLASLAENTRRDCMSRVSVAEKLAEVGDRRGPDALARIIQDTNQFAWHRVTAARKLAELGDPRGIGLLALCAEDANGDSSFRVQSARALGELGDLRGVDVLALLVQDADCDVELRVQSARALGELGDLRGVDVLALLAQDADCDVELRVQSARALGELGDLRGVDVLALLAQDADRDDGQQVTAARALAEVGDQRGADLLARFAQDPHRDDFNRVEAATALAEVEVGGWRGVELLKLLADDPKLDSAAQQEAFIASYQRY
ncbi:trypsin-like peptidase domain-containing protein [Streptomyces indiaensis]|uniref:HEAT repeat domain-containing protein n=1 Tax=Streptomyces indiaensis TaxID=284033 RepID=A0ABN3DZK8_9ACTN